MALRRRICVARYICIIIVSSLGLAAHTHQLEQRWASFARLLFSLRRDWFLHRLRILQQTSKVEERKLSSRQAALKEDSQAQPLKHQQEPHG